MDPSTGRHPGIEGGCGVIRRAIFGGALACFYVAAAFGAAGYLLFRASEARR